jgi:radical SAM protein
MIELQVTEGRRVIRELRLDLDKRPFLVLLELTRACSLSCRHCRATAIRERSPNELATDEVLAVLDDLAALGPPRPIVVCTGGDPLERDDLEQILAHGSAVGLRMACSPAATPRVAAHMAMLREAGASTISLSLDGSSSARHDDFRRTQGSFGWTLAACEAAREAGLHLQVNTTVSAATLSDLPALYQLVRTLGVNLWSVFFVVPTGRGRELTPLDAEETERALVQLAEWATELPLKTTAAPHFRRVLLERAKHAPDRDESVRRAPLAVNDGRGVVFVAHDGIVQPSGFLPVAVGSVRQRPLSWWYAHSPLLRALRDPERLTGRCGICPYRTVCGGSRAQAYARTGDLFGEDPSCAYDPGNRVAGDRAEASTRPGRW